MEKKLQFRLSLIGLILSLTSLWFIYERLIKRPFALPLFANNQPWYVQSGLKIVTLQNQIMTVDRVVLVPDSATFLAAIQAWNLKERWPILIEDNYYTPLFIRRFQPLEIIRLPSVQKSLPQGEKLRELMLQSVIAAWNSKDQKSLKETWQQLGWNPPGIVITDEQDSAWPAAVALAADRGQPLAFLSGDYGKPNDTLDETHWLELSSQVLELVSQSGYEYASLDDDIDTITLVKNLAVKYEDPINQDKKLAVTDGLGRYQNGERWAIAGWIYGSETRSLYQAMCAIFLNPNTAMLYDSYSPEKPWNLYSLSSAGQLLKNQGFHVSFLQRPETHLKNWLKLKQFPWNFDLILINSKGTSAQFFVGDQQASVPDIPQLKYPAALSIIHSFSAMNPADPNTIAGKWLERGVYAYIGSVDEPFLSAFIRPEMMVKRLITSTPFLIAGRYFNSPPGKITTIGDPLMIITQARQRIPSHQSQTNRLFLDPNILPKK